MRRSSSWSLLWLAIRSQLLADWTARWLVLFVTSPVVVMSCISVIFFSACGVAHVKEYTPKQREYTPPDDCVIEAVAEHPGQLYNTNTRDFYRDFRAYRVCDIVRIDVVERSTATNDARTEVQNDGSLRFGGDILGQLKVSGINGIDTERLLDFASQVSSDRFGATRRTGDVDFSISATVKKVFSNGNIFLEGETAILVNSEENHFYVSGVARPEDVQANNSILSSRLADAHIEFTGRGIIAEGQEPGWLARIWNWILSPL